MRPNVYWVSTLDIRLALMARPRAGDWLQEEVIGWKAIGLDVIISLLEDVECRELGLETEETLCRGESIEFIRFPIRDRGIPMSLQAFTSFVEFIVNLLREGMSIGIHCRAGIGRTGLVAGCVLGILGKQKQEIFPLLTSTRGISVPDTKEQEEWVYSFIKGYQAHTLKDAF